jgi:hypothetical protein
VPGPAGGGGGEGCSVPRSGCRGSAQGPAGSLEGARPSGVVSWPEDMTQAPAGPPPPPGPRPDARPPGHHEGEQFAGGDGQHAGAHQGLGAEPGPGEADHDAISPSGPDGARLAHVSEDHVLQADRPDGPGRVEDRFLSADQQGALLAGVAFLDGLPARRERAGVTCSATISIRSRRNSRRARGSRLATGSSSSSNPGRLATARVRASWARWPPDSDPARCGLRPSWLMRRAASSLSQPGLSRAPIRRWPATESLRRPARPRRGSRPGRAAPGCRSAARPGR